MVHPELQTLPAGVGADMGGQTDNSGPLTPKMSAACRGHYATWINSIL